VAGIIKRFLEWMTVKEKLHNSNAVPPLVKERDLWWVSFGENIGSEMNGKSKLFSRPGIVIKKLSREFYLVAPTTSQKKEGTWYVPIRQEGKDVFVCLHQIRTIDYRRLSSRLGQIDRTDKIGLGFPLGKSLDNKNRHTGNGNGDKKNNHDRDSQRHSSFIQKRHWARPI